MPSRKSGKPQSRLDPFGHASRPSGSSRTRRVGLGWLAAGGAVLVTGAVGTAFMVSRAAPPATANLDLDVVTVDSPAVDLGHVRLDVAVPVTVRLLNQSRKTVMLGQATADALEGC
jgi:hypothetical protein